MWSVEGPVADDGVPLEPTPHLYDPLLSSLHPQVELPSNVQEPGQKNICLKR